MPVQINGPLAPRATPVTDSTPIHEPRTPLPSLIILTPVSGHSPRQRTGPFYDPGAIKYAGVTTSPGWPKAMRTTPAELASYRAPGTAPGPTILAWPVRSAPRPWP